LPFPKPSHIDSEGADPQAFRRDEFQSMADFCHGIFRAIGLQRAMLTPPDCDLLFQIILKGLEKLEILLSRSFW
jgi:hypothetical protein